MKKLAVFGNPIAQSKSPFIHKMFAKAQGIELEYKAILGSEENFEEQLQQFFADQDAVGVNVTMPFKARAAAWATICSSEVDHADAANTLVKTSQGINAYTTDGVGLVSDLERLSMPIKHSRILLIGAGGAARGAMTSILSAQPSSVTIANRNMQNAQKLVDIANHPTVDALSFSSAHTRDYDLIINATSLSLQDQVPDIDRVIFSTQPAVYDMVYQSQPTAFMSLAKQAGCTHTADGLGMLVSQAAESFNIWFAVKPSVDEVLIALREQLTHGK